MRGIAALMVVIFHFTSRYAALYPQSPETGWRFALGGYGVDFFFVLSGFVIFLSLERCAGPLQFAWLRFWRLFPVYWVSVILTALLIWFAGAPGQQDGLNVLVVIENLAMIHQFFHVPNVEGVYWTLAYEFAFYGWAALLYFALPRHRIEMIVLIYATLAFVVTVVVNSAGYEIPYALTLAFLLDYAQLFAAGVMLFHVWRDGLSGSRVLMLLWFALMHGYLHGMIGLVLIAGVFLSILAVMRGALGWLKNPVLLFFGAISYSLYLMHETFGHSVMYHLIARGVSPRLATLVALIASILMATLLTFLIERPTLRLVRQRSRLRPGAALSPSAH